MSVVLITTEGGFERLRPYWEKLLSRSYSPEVFRKWEWLYTWWQVFGGGAKRLAILAVQEGSDVRAIAPLYVEEREGILRSVRVVRLLGDDVVGSDFLDWIVPCDEEQTLVNRLTDAMLEAFGPGSVCDFRDIGADSVLARRVVPLLSERQMTVRQLVRFACPYLELPRDFSELEKRFSPRTRESLRRKLRKFQSLPGYEMWVSGEQIALEDALRVLWDLHDRRWQGNERDSTRRAGFREFHARLASRMRPHLEVVLLRAQGKPVSAQYNFRFDGKVYQYQSGFDPVFASFSPGTVLMLQVLRRAIAAGYHRFEMLRGEEAYKSRFARSRRITYRVVACGRSVTLSRYLFPHTLRDIGRRLRKKLREEA